MTMDQIPAVDAVRLQASRSSFYAAMRVMPKAKRDGMFAIYAFCRAVDDIADDGKGTRDERRAALDAWRADIASHCTGTPTARTAFLSEVIADFRPRLEDFLAVIDGMQMDVDADIFAPSLAELDLYCDRVASAVGRLSVKVFGMDETPGFALAHHMGRALQLTNILRDLDEDAGLDRLYLPREHLDAAGIGGGLHDVLKHPALDRACRSLAGIAYEHYRQAWQIIRTKPEGDLRAAKLMASVYREILKRTERTGWAPPRTRARIPKLHLVYFLLRHGFSA